MSRFTDQKKRSVVIEGVDTTIKIEACFWHFIETLAKAKGIPWREFVRRLDRARPRDLQNRASWLRVCCFMLAARQPKQYGSLDLLEN
jgi:predicted DNA-binding ribbon-helix-helix protein